MSVPQGCCGDEMTPVGAEHCLPCIKVPVTPLPLDKGGCAHRDSGDREASAALCLIAAAFLSVLFTFSCSLFISYYLVNSFKCVICCKLLEFMFSVWLTQKYQTVDFTQIYV